MEFVDNTGHIFSLPSFNEKPIGYEFEENDYVFWMNDQSLYRLSINNYYIKVVYALYQTDNLDNCNVEIYFNNSNVYSLVSPIKIQEYISSLDNINGIIDIDSVLDTSLSKITNEDIYAIYTTENIGGNNIDYCIIPIYVVATSDSEGSWLSNLMIHINDNNNETWCPITFGGVFVDEYEELIINGQNMGINLPKDIIKAVYSESFFNDEYNVETYNRKLKEYLLNYMGIHGEIGNYNSAIKSLKWFEYGDRLSISKLLKTDNDVQSQYIRDYFNIENDVLKSFYKFKLDSLISLTLMINKELEEIYPIDFSTGWLMGENKPKLLDLLDFYEKIKIGNHDMPIDDDVEKYFYWKPYFDFSFNELGLKLACLKYYYKKYFLPIHLNVHTASLGQRVFANDIKWSNYAQSNCALPIAYTYKNENEVEFLGNNLHYFTKQIHYVDDNFNEFNQTYINKNNNTIFYELNDTCINIPIRFKSNRLYNCILILERQNYKNIEYIHYIKRPIEIKLHIDKENHNYTTSVSELNIYKNFELLNLNNMKFAYKYGNENLYSEYFNGFDNMLNDAYKIVLGVNNIDYEAEQPHYETEINIKIKCEIDKFDNIVIDSNYVDDEIYLDNCCDVLLEKHFSFYNGDDNYKNFILYPKKINVKNFIETNLFEYWINSNYVLKLCVNGRWYEYTFKTAISKPVIDFGRLKYKYYLNNVKSLVNTVITEDDYDHYLLMLSNKDETNTINEDIEIEDDYDWEDLYAKLNLDDNYSLIVPVDTNNELYNTAIDYGMLSFFNQLSDITNDKVSFNAYMHNPSFIETNHINFDIDIFKILKYNLENNLQYIDGELINNQFYRYIEYYSSIYNNDYRLEIFFSNEENNIYGLTCYKLVDNMHKKVFVHYNYDTNEYLIYDMHNKLLGTWEENEKLYFKYEIYIHNDLIGKNINIIQTTLSNLKHTLICAYGQNIYILRETDENSNKYVIINDDYTVFEGINTEDAVLNNEQNCQRKGTYKLDENVKYDAYPLWGEFLINLESIEFEFRYEDNCYVTKDKDNNITGVYPIYDKLYSNEDHIYGNYVYKPNITNNLGYLNLIHLFGIYNRKYKETNMLNFNKNIDVRVNGINFKHINRISENTGGVTLNEVYYCDEFKVSGHLFHQIIDSDTRFPDAYGLYWDHYFTDYSKNEYTISGLMPGNRTVTVLETVETWYYCKNNEEIPIDIEISINENNHTEYLFTNIEGYSFIIEKIDDNTYKQWDTNKRASREVNVMVAPYRYLYIKEDPIGYQNYGLYVKRIFDFNKELNQWTESNFEIETDPYVTNEYDYYEDVDQLTSLGTCEFRKLEDFYNANYIEGTKSFEGEFFLEGDIYKWTDPNMYEVNNNMINHTYNLLYYIYIIRNGEKDLLDTAAIYTEDYDSIYVEFFYNKLHLIKNKYYELPDFLESVHVNAHKEDDGRYYTYNNNVKKEVKINKQGDEYYLSWNDYTYTNPVKILKTANIQRYTDHWGNEIKIQNPSGYWYDVDNNEIVPLDKSLNELERYWFVENEMESYGNTIEEIEEQLSIYKEKLQNATEYGLNMDNAIELRYRYKNYLVKNFTGSKGLFRTEWNIIDIEGTRNPSDLFNLCVCITREDNTVEVINTNHTNFELTGNEKEVLVYFRLKTKDIDIDEIDEFIVHPKIMAISEYNERLKYDPNEATDLTKGSLLNVRINNQEYIYGDNSSDFIINLYKDFFECKYRLYDLYKNDENTLSKKLIYSIWECNDNIKLSNDAKYDFYLMHDNEYWYGLYISRLTCDQINNKDIQIKYDDKILNLNYNYVLKYERSSKEFLINRMDYNSANGYNHFNNNEIIAARMINNDRLPIRMDISSKWKITYASLGMSLSEEFESDAETTIISMPMNDNKYQRGYYNATIKYSLDRDLQHQFKNTATFRVE